MAHHQLISRCVDALSHTRQSSSCHGVVKLTYILLLRNNAHLDAIVIQDDATVGTETRVMDALGYIDLELLRTQGLLALCVVLLPSLNADLSTFKINQPFSALYLDAKLSRWVKASTGSEKYVEKGC